MTEFRLLFTLPEALAKADARRTFYWPAEAPGSFATKLKQRFGELGPVTSLHADFARIAILGYAADRAVVRERLVAHRVLLGAADGPHNHEVCRARGTSRVSSGSPSGAGQGNPVDNFRGQGGGRHTVVPRAGPIRGPAPASGENMSFTVDVSQIHNTSGEMNRNAAELEHALARVVGSVQTLSLIHISEPTRPY